MSRLSFHIDIVKKRPITVAYATLRVGHRAGKVIFQADNRLAELSTSDALGAGMAVQKSLATLEDDEMYAINVNGAIIDLLPEQARRVSVGLLRKAAQADDFQRGIKR